HVPAHHFPRVDAEKRLHPAQQEVGNHAERVQVGTCIDFQGGRRRLRRHVEGRPYGGAITREVGVFVQALLHQAEVEHFHQVGHATPVADHDVLRLDVAVYEAGVV